MIIRRYRNGVLVSEDVPAAKPVAPSNPTQSPPLPAKKPIPTAPKKGCGCGKKKP